MLWRLYWLDYSTIKHGFVMAMKFPIICQKCQLSVQISYVKLNNQLIK